ncbi:MAG: hypothetical protein HQK91_03855 [Nitrospirae bacterium]|nr:hypothetical protein [Nitrospirota bacterium]MBF0540571.1 hypothetical protein [Nitrospirota bacterium]
MLTSLHLKTLFWLAVIAWVLILLIEGQSPTVSLLKPSSLVLFGMITVVTIFEKWGWRIPFLHSWFVSNPNLIGTYKGDLDSCWIDPATGLKRGPIPAFLVICQTLSTIHVRLYTVESESCSVLGAFIKAADGKQELLFTYRNEPRLEKRTQSPIHYGGTRLTVSHATQKLEGSYWTDRQTLGEMKFARVSRKTAHSFQECEALIPYV